MYMQILESH